MFNSSRLFTLSLSSFAACPTEKKVESEYTDLKIPAEDIYSQPSSPCASATTIRGTISVKLHSTPALLCQCILEVLV